MRTFFHLEEAAEWIDKGEVEEFMVERAIPPQALLSQHLLTTDKELLKSGVRAKLLE